MVRRWACALTGGLACGAIAACRAPTQVTVELSTDVGCAEMPITALRVGRPLDIEDRAPIVETTKCSSDGRIGSIVLVPSAGEHESIVISAVLAHGGRTAASCEGRGREASGSSGCIVARRELAYWPHTELTVPIDLRRDCDGIDCPTSHTCVHGTCVDARIPASSICGGSGCPDSVLWPDKPIGAPSVDASEDRSSDGAPDVALREEGSIEASLADAGDAGSDVSLDAGADVSFDSELADVDPDGDVQSPTVDVTSEPPIVDADGSSFVDDWESWLSFSNDHAAHYAARRVECLHEPVGRYRLVMPEQRYTLRQSVRLGLVSLDRVAMGECLRALDNADCDAIAALVQVTDLSAPGVVPAFEACSRVVVGRLPVGGRCLEASNCVAGSRNSCTSSVNGRCTGDCVATMPAAVGESCTGRECALGAVCANDSPSQESKVCLTGHEGSICFIQWDCAPTYHCVLGPSGYGATGHCQPVRIGEPCDGTWSCPEALRCVGRTPEVRGTCQPGKREGEPCTPQGIYDGFEVSDCTLGTQCLDADGTGPRCVGPGAPGARCGSFRGPLGTEMIVWCLEGECTQTAQDRRSCLPVVPAGARCAFGVVCAAPFQCLGNAPYPSTCMLPMELPAGAKCYENGPPYCEPGTACRRIADYTVEGFCEPYKQAGEKCSRPDDCDQRLACILGTCRPC